MKTLLKFEADWCGPCKQVKPVVKDVIEEHDDQVELKTIDVDKAENQELVREHGIRAVPTFVLMEGDEVLNTYQGTISRSDLKQFIEGKMDDTDIPLVARSI
ncbi:MAG: thioredoxin family protein [Pseudomonadales bacterium]|nr:thioredoxin family protein [Pseudomonadales bacterium]